MKPSGKTGIMAPTFEPKKRDRVQSAGGNRGIGRRRPGKQTLAPQKEPVKKNDESVGTDTNQEVAVGS
jgi:hypothetical protein